MPVETAADRAIFVDADDFASAVAWTRGITVHQFTAIFDAEYLLLSSPLIDGGVEGSGPQIHCRTADLPSGAAQGDAVAVTNPETLAVSNFVAVELQPDGTGMTIVRLQES